MKLKKNKEKKVNKEVYRDSSNTEIYRELRTNIEFSSFHKNIQVICVTSSNPDEGKTVISSNLSIVSVAKYNKVLLIDCDLRKPSIHKTFDLSNREGLSNLLLEKGINIENEKYFQKFKDENTQGELYVLTSGMKVPNPLELLSSDKFKKLIDKLREHFDFIVIDSPPVLLVSDAIPISHVSDGTLFVISAADTNKNHAKLALTQLQRNGVNVIGSVLNKVETDKDDYHYNYYY